MRQPAVLRFARSAVVLVACWSWLGAAALAGEPRAAADPAADPAEPSAPADPAEPMGAAAIFDAVTVVASKVEERVGDIAGTASVIARAELDARLVQDAADLVRYEPGASAAGQAGRFGLSGLRLRGVDGNRVAIELDGVPLREAFAVGSFANAGRAAIEPELLAAVAILRGPASALHGSDALGGVVALTTRSPGDLVGGAPDQALEVHVGSDGRDGGRRASVLTAASRGAWQALAQVAWRQAGELDNQGSVDPDPASRDDRSALLRAVHLSAHGLFDVTVDHRESTVETEVRHLVHGAGQFATTESLLADDRDERTRVVLRQSFVTGQAGLEEGELRLAWSRSATLQETAQLRSADARTPATRRERSFALDETWIGAEWNGRSRLVTGGLVHQLVWGVELDRADLRELRDGRETNLATGAVTPVILGERMPVRDFPRSTVTSAALFLADDLALADGRWRLQPALRYERTTTDAEPDALYREDFPQTPVVDLDDASWTPKLGLTRTFGHGHSAYAQFAEGFRAPPFHDVNVGLRIATFGYEAIPNPLLRPEQSRGVEVGWRYAGSRLSAHLALYENRYRDLIESRANLGRDPVTGWTIFQSINRDRATIRGVEARWRLDLGEIAGAAHGFTVDGGFAWADGEDSRRRQPLNSVDPAKVTLGLAYLAPGSRFAASAVGSWVASKRGKVDISTANVFAPPSYGLLDLYGEWRPLPGWTLHVAVLNALDRRYWSFARVRGVLANDPQLDFHSEPGRAVVVGLAWRR